MRSFLLFAVFFLFNFVDYFFAKVNATVHSTEKNHVVLESVALQSSSLSKLGEPTDGKQSPQLLPYNVEQQGAPISKASAPPNGWPEVTGELSETSHPKADASSHVTASAPAVRLADDSTTVGVLLEQSESVSGGVSSAGSLASSKTVASSVFPLENRADKNTESQRRESFSGQKKAVAFDDSQFFVGNNGFEGSAGKIRKAPLARRQLAAKVAGQEDSQKRTEEELLEDLLAFSSPSTRTVEPPSPVPFVDYGDDDQDDEEVFDFSTNDSDLDEGDTWSEDGDDADGTGGNATAITTALPSKSNGKVLPAVLGATGAVGLIGVALGTHLVRRKAQQVNEKAYEGQFENDNGADTEMSTERWQ